MPRSSQIDLDVTHFYHCHTRCVRRAFLCGEDKATGKRFDHRKVWIIERLKYLASIFGVRIVAYGILSNHLHLVLRALVEMVASWRDEEVIRRAGLLCPSTTKNIENWSKKERDQFVAKWRRRLSSISFFMARLDEYIARKANEEDGCTGRFWEGRFKSQALMDHAGVLACMAYVDLNEIRAGLADSLEDSSFSSISQRIEEMLLNSGSHCSTARSDSNQQCSDGDSGKSANPSTDVAPSAPRPSTASVPKNSSPRRTLSQCPSLAPMREPSDLSPQDDVGTLDIPFLNYLELLTWTGTILRPESKASIKDPLPDHLQQLLRSNGLEPNGWLDAVLNFSHFGSFVGSPARLHQCARNLGRRRRLRGHRTAEAVYMSVAA
jgi:REP element-mobilizing transposase RayT